MLAYYVHNLDPFIFRISGNFGPRWYGMAYVLAFVFAYLLLRVLSKRGFLDLPASVLGDFVTWVALFGVMVGGRLGYVLFYKPEMIRDPMAPTGACVFIMLDPARVSHHPLTLRNVARYATEAGAVGNAVTAVYMFCCIPFGLAALLMFRFVRIALGKSEAASAPALQRRIL